MKRPRGSGDNRGRRRSHPRTTTRAPTRRRCCVKLARVADAFSGADGTAGRRASLSVELDFGNKADLPDPQVSGSAAVGTRNQALTSAHNASDTSSLNRLIQAPPRLQFQPSRHPYPWPPPSPRADDAPALLQSAPKRAACVADLAIRATPVGSPQPPLHSARAPARAARPRRLAPNSSHEAAHRGPSTTSAPHGVLCRTAVKRTIQRHIPARIGPATPLHWVATNRARFRDTRFHATHGSCNMCTTLMSCACKRC